MKAWFGDEISEQGPMAFLRSHGFELTKGFVWRKPTPSYTLSETEIICINFLFDEWDFGGIDV
jgi:hypothetical protein